MNAKLVNSTSFTRRYTRRNWNWSMKIQTILTIALILLIYFTWATRVKLQMSGRFLREVYPCLYTCTWILIIQIIQLLRNKLEMEPAIHGPTMLTVGLIAETVKHLTWLLIQPVLPQIQKMYWTMCAIWST